jgi:hypothetical protein
MTLSPSLISLKGIKKGELGSIPVVFLLGGSDGEDLFTPWWKNDQP